jgi:hypothetical protein
MVNAGQLWMPRTGKARPLIPARPLQLCAVSLKLVLGSTPVSKSATNATGTTAALARSACAKAMRARRSTLARGHLRRLSLTTTPLGISVKARLRSRWTLADSGECSNTLSIAESAILGFAAPRPRRDR